jgi:hypothetical protein
MKMPGFTAEASLFNGDMCYHATAKATVYGGVVRPAAIYDIYTPSFPLYCRLVYKCRTYGYGQPFQLCSWVYVCG